MTKEDAERFGEAELSSCDDNGAGAPGSYFTDDPERVTVWSFDGHSPNEVLGVQLTHASYTVYVAVSLSDNVRDRILDDLRATRR